MSEIIQHGRSKKSIVSGDAQWIDAIEFFHSGFLNKFKKNQRLLFLDADGV